MPSVDQTHALTQAIVRYLQHGNCLPPGGRRFGEGIQIGHRDTGYIEHPETFNDRLLVSNGYGGRPTIYPILLRALSNDRNHFWCINLVKERSEMVFESIIFRGWIKLVYAAGVGVFFSSCTSNVQKSAHDFSKELEGGAYDNVAEVLSEYCDKVYDKSLWIQRTRIEARREIRQSKKGRRGPSPPAKPVHGLDEKTSNGNGPVLRIWCQGEEVPDFIWEEMVRNWRD